jgi:NAD(P)-dependent dehydrogenase (short-subunit alcohol dehydrogenase family)
VNHIGHFALTGLLADRPTAMAGSRVINVSSVAHRRDNMNFDDQDFEARGYNAGEAYAQSKLANLLFSAELSCRLGATDAGVLVA